jgi:hypothetical protein
MDMMGVGEFNPTLAQKRLRTIICCRPVIRRFRFESHRARQREFLDLRVKFETAKTPQLVEEIGKKLLTMDQQLSEAQDTNYLDRLEA